MGSISYLKSFVVGRGTKDPFSLKTFTGVQFNISLSATKRRSPKRA